MSQTGFATKSAQLSRPEVARVVASLGEGVAFRADTTEVNVARLHFSESLHLYRVTSFERLPVTELWFLSNSNHTVMLWSISSIKDLRAQFDIQLNVSNFFDFVLFYIEFVSADALQPLINISSVHELHKAFIFSVPIDEIVEKGTAPEIELRDGQLIARFLATHDSKIVLLSLCATLDGDIISVRNESLSNLAPRSVAESTGLS